MNDVNEHDSNKGLMMLSVDEMTVLSNQRRDFPERGDQWNERAFNFVLQVIDVNDYAVLVADQKVQSNELYYIDYSRPKVMSRARFREATRHADVRIGQYGSATDYEAAARAHLRMPQNEFERDALMQQEAYEKRMFQTQGAAAPSPILARTSGYQWLTYQGMKFLAYWDASIQSYLGPDDQPVKYNGPMWVGVSHD